MSAEPTPMLLTAAVLLTAIAAFCDLRTGLIPNRLIAIGAGVLLGVRLFEAAAADGRTGVLASLGAGAAGMAVTALVPFLLYRFGGIGGGDVKLLGLLGLALGPMVGLEAELYAFALTLLYAPARLLYEGTLIRTLSASAALLVRPFMRAAERGSRPTPALTSFRFGPAVCLATLLAAALQVGGP